jgi:hypothetical protein
MYTGFWSGDEITDTFGIRSGSEAA